MSPIFRTDRPHEPANAKSEMCRWIANQGERVLAELAAVGLTRDGVEGVAALAEAARELLLLKLDRPSHRRMVELLTTAQLIDSLYHHKFNPTEGDSA